MHHNDVVFLVEMLKNPDFPPEIVLIHALHRRVLTLEDMLAKVYYNGQELKAKDWDNVNRESPFFILKFKAEEKDEAYQQLYLLLEKRAFEQKDTSLGPSIEFFQQAVKLELFRRQPRSLSL